MQNILAGFTALIAANLRNAVLPLRAIQSKLSTGDRLQHVIPTRLPDEHSQRNALEGEHDANVMTGRAVRSNQRRTSDDCGEWARQEYPSPRRVSPTLRHVDF